MTNDLQAVVYYAVGAFTRTQRAERDSQLLKDPKGEPPEPPGRPPIVAPPPTEPSARAPVVNAPGTTPGSHGGLRLVVRHVAHRDDNVSLEIERFQPSWPGKDSSGKPQDPEEAFREWLGSAEGRARFGSASAVALHAIHVDFESAYK